ncbi:MAG: cyclic lactone autoinducer peptide [Lachnospiraceae bacterium]|nr:cyclic lactone autoinducer peptide [Lachnospiraceae bacterium]
MKKQENVGSKVLRVVEKIVRNEVEKNCFDWPPVCMGIFHQPKRPKNVKKENNSL